MAPVVAAAALWNGERVVVLLFVSVIMFSLPLSLLVHGLAFCLVAVAAFFVEIRLEFSPPISQFKMRPGASSGILLGAVTLPGVFVSKLIQMSRALSLHQVDLQEVEYLKMQYWAATAASIGVLIFFWLLVKQLLSSSYSSCSHRIWAVRFGTSFTSLCATFCCLSLASVSYFGLRPELRLLWVLCHGLAAIKLIQHLLTTFPSCASIGEALLVTSGLVLYFSDMLMCSSTKISERIAPSDTLSGYKIGRSEISIIIQGVLLGLLLFPVIFKVIQQIWEYFTSTKSRDSRAENDFRRSLVFFLSLCFILTIIIPSWMQFVNDFDSHPVLWVFNFVLKDPLKRLTLCIYWVALICASVLQFYNISKNSKVERILLRKYYHLLAVSMFSPALIYQPDLLDLAFGAALAVFLVLEIVRVWKIWPFGEPIHKFMNAFTDHRDSDLLIISHFSLLLGCALPIWLSSAYNDRPLAPFAGILSLGIGDTMASMVGHKYGVLRWSKSGKKTIEGTAAGITSVLVACVILVPVLASNGYIQQALVSFFVEIWCLCVITLEKSNRLSNSSSYTHFILVILPGQSPNKLATSAQHWMWVLVAVTVSGLLEAYTAQLDNAFIPLVFYSLLICL